MTERLRLNPRLSGIRYVLRLHGELDAFGLDVLQRGVRSRARGRPVRFEGGMLVA